MKLPRLRRRKTDTRPRRRPVRERHLITDFLPPEGVPIRFGIAGLGTRLVAQLVDILITLAALIALLALLVYSNLVNMAGLITVGALLFFFIRAPYYTLLEILMNGQTLGKRLSGLKVVSADGRTLSSHAVVVRNLMKEVEIFVPGSMLLASSSLEVSEALVLLSWITILLAVPLTNRKRQRLGDILAGTYVVVLPTPVLLPDLADDPIALTDEAFTFLQHQLDHYGRYELQTLEALLQVDTSAMKRPARERHETNLRKVAETIVRRIDYRDQIAPQAAEGFLRAFYRTQRAYLENRRLFGDTREDKYHREPDKTQTKG